MPVTHFLNGVQKIAADGKATEHSYRFEIQALLLSLDPQITALNEPRRVECGAPDFIIQRGEIAIGHLEAKDLDVSLRGMKGANLAQQERYRQALPNLIYTNCLDWDFCRNGERIASVSIATLKDG